MNNTRTTYGTNLAYDTSETVIANGQNKLQSNITLAKTDVKLAVNKSLYMKGIITEEMYIKAREMLIKTAPTNNSPKKNTPDFYDR